MTRRKSIGVSSSLGTGSDDQGVAISQLYPAQALTATPTDAPKTIPEESAGINRPEVADERAAQRRSSDPL